MNAKTRISICAIALSAMFLSACGQDRGTAPIADGPLPIPSGTYAIDRNHTYVTFSYLHQGLSYPLLRATSIDGELELDTAAMINSAVSVAVRVDSIRTNLDYFDRELASRKFFHAEKYPYITFTTHRYDPVSDVEGKLTGFVTIRDVTRPLELDVKINGAMNIPQIDIPAIGFSATGTLNRADFGLDRFVPTVANQVEIKIEAEFWQGSNDRSAAAARIARETTASADPASLEIVAGNRGKR